MYVFRATSCIYKYLVLLFFLYTISFDNYIRITPRSTQEIVETWSDYKWAYGLPMPDVHSRKYDPEDEDNSRVKF